MVNSAAAESHLLEKAGLTQSEAYRFDRARVYIERMGRQAKMDAIKLVLKKLKRWLDEVDDVKARREIRAQMKHFVAQYKSMKEIEDNWKGEPPRFTLSTPK